MMPIRSKDGSSLCACVFGHPPKRVLPRKFVPKLGMAIPENIGMLETGNIVYNTLDEKMHRLRGRSDHMFCSMSSSRKQFFLEPV